MARTKSPLRAKSKEMWLNSGKERKLEDIAEELGVQPSQIRKWKNQDNWDDEPIPPLVIGKQEVRRRGAPKGSKNGKGAPKGNKRAKKHGAYETIYWDSLDEEERAMLEDINWEEEVLLREQISLLSVRERRIMKAIQERRQDNKLLTVDSVRKRKSETRKIEHGMRSSEDVEETETNTVTNLEVILRLETELTKVQSKKTSAINALSKIREDRRKVEDSEKGDKVVEDWIQAVMFGDG